MDEQGFRVEIWGIGLLHEVTVLAAGVKTCRAECKIFSPKLKTPPKI